MDKYPLVFLIALPTTITKILYYMIIGYGKDYVVDNIYPFESIKSLFQQEIIIIIALVSIFVIGIIFLFIYPSVLNYIYRACTDTAKKGWYKEGLKKNTFKLLLLYLLSVIIIFFTTISFFYLLITLQSDHLDAFILPLAILTSIILINIQIGTVSVVVEKNLKATTKAFFKYFIDIFFPLYGALILLRIPVTLIENAQKIGFIQPPELWHHLFTESGNYTTNKIVWSIVLIVLSILVDIFVTTFIYTYLTHKYIDVKNEYYERKENEKAKELA